MFLNSLHFLIVICLTTQALRVAVLSQTLDSKFPLLDVLAGIPSKAWSPIRARIQPAAAAAATGGITNNAQQSQNVTNTAGMNGTDPLPGLITNPTYESPMINCSDLSTGRDNKCWSDLNLTRWVEMWVEVNPCYQNEAFASCFLRKEGFPGLDCTGIKVSSCTSPNVAGMDPITFYVAYNIYGRHFQPNHLGLGLADVSLSNKSVLSIMVHRSWKLSGNRIQQCRYNRAAP